MEIQKFENLITDNLDEIVTQIIHANPILTIAVKRGERVGDGISKYLENKFVEFTQQHKYFKESIASPVGKTKNPFDVQTIFEFKGHKELIWIDFKAINIENQDTNPDSGTPDKVITLMLNGYFYLAYVMVYYKGIEQGMEFGQYKELYAKSYFLKNVSPTMRITPANQIQVNGFAEPVYRTRKDFLEFLIAKKIGSNERKLKKAMSELENLKVGIIKKGTSEQEEITLQKLFKLNEEQEQKIKKI